MAVVEFVYHFLQYAQEHGTCNKFAEKLFNDFALQFETCERILNDQGGEF